MGRAASPGLVAARREAKARFFAALGDDEAAIRYEVLADKNPAQRDEYLARARQARESASRNRKGKV